MSGLRAKARAALGTVRDLAEGLSRPTFRDSLATELGLTPRALRVLLPWIVRTRSTADSSLLKVALANAEQNPTGLAIEMGDVRVTWQGLADQSSRFAHVLEASGVRRGDVVALLGNNSPSYLAIVLAISRVGATAALINSRIEAQPLAHALISSNARVAVVEAELRDRVTTLPAVMDRLSRLLTFREGDLDAEAKAAPSRPFQRVVVEAGSDFVYIYTSGTTGLPKPCRVTHAKAVLTGAMMGKLVWEFGVEDKLYSVLPLYHSSALLLGFCATVMTGTPIALRESFSARAFFSDIARYRATAILYIGELCRYLLNTPEDPSESLGLVRVAVGNGLRADLWEPFQSRFRIGQIREFYGATESPGAIFNLTGRVGSVGRMPMRRLTSLKLIRYDIDRDEHVRGPGGLCVECGPGETGELVITLKDSPLTAISEFRGYTDAEATARKVLRDVFAQGDRCYRSGDLMRFDEDDYFYFVDRIGDTFRFKGENVSTAEVAQVVGQSAGVSAVAVTGIAIPGVDGRAGLAAVVCVSEFDAEALWQTAQGLPEYAQPRVVRVMTGLDTTATFKVQKTRLASEGVDPAKGEFYLRRDGRYERLTDELWASVTSGATRILGCSRAPPA